jgi:hypothetical protein
VVNIAKSCSLKQTPAFIKAGVSGNTKMKDRVVILKSFLGIIQPKKGTSSRENYWQLIGERGVIIDDQENDGRVLVLFQCNLDNYQVENHNPVKNSLWIKTTDLKFEN